jgi:hypothetical protein
MHGKCLRQSGDKTSSTCGIIIERARFKTIFKLYLSRGMRFFHWAWPVYIFRVLARTKIRSPCLALRGARQAWRDVSVPRRRHGQALRQRWGRHRRPDLRCRPAACDYANDDGDGRYWPPRWAMPPCPDHAARPGRPATRCPCWVCHGWPRRWGQRRHPVPRPAQGMRGSGRRRGSMPGRARRKGWRTGRRA